MLTDKQSGLGVTALQAGQRPGPPQAKSESQGENEKQNKAKGEKIR